MAKIKANLAGVDPGTERVCPPDGLYEGVVVEMIDDKPTNGKDPRLVVIVEIANHEDERYNGYKLWNYFPYDKGTKTWSKESPMAWKVVQMLLALYGTDKVTIDTDNPPEEPFQFKGKVETYQNKDRLKLDTWLPLDAEEDELEDEDEEEPEDEDADDQDDDGDEDDEDEDDQDDEEEDEDEEEEPEPQPRSRRSSKTAAPAPAAKGKTRQAKPAPAPEPEEDEEDVPDYPEWTTAQLEDEVKVRKLQLTLPRADKAKRKAMIDALNADDEAAEDPLA